MQFGLLSSVKVSLVKGTVVVFIFCGFLDRAQRKIAVRAMHSAMRTESVADWAPGGANESAPSTFEQRQQCSLCLHNVAWWLCKKQSARAKAKASGAAARVLCWAAEQARQRSR